MLGHSVGAGNKTCTGKMNKKYKSAVEFLGREIGAGSSSETCGRVASATHLEMCRARMVSYGKLFKVDGIVQRP